MIEIGQLCYTDWGILRAVAIRESDYEEFREIGFINDGKLAWMLEDYVETFGG